MGFPVLLRKLQEFPGPISRQASSKKEPPHPERSFIVSFEAVSAGFSPLRSASYRKTLPRGDFAKEPFRAEHDSFYEQAVAPLRRLEKNTSGVAQGMGRPVSSLVFITTGPPQAMGSLSGFADSSRNRAPLPGRRQGFFIAPVTHHLACRRLPSDFDVSENKGKPRSSMELSLGLERSIFNTVRLRFQRL